jgi:hypothetical protein
MQVEIKICFWRITHVEPQGADSSSRRETIAQAGWSGLEGIASIV